jgi:hypothetical protein
MQQIDPLLATYPSPQVAWVELLETEGSVSSRLP